ncbi:MAG: glycosyltransferase family 39 protein, partial [Vicinamibacterales bacterium]
MKLALAAFAATNLALVAVMGVRTGGDTGLYLDGARRLIEGEPLIDREPSYVGYVALVALCQSIGVGLTGLVIVQVAMATASAGAVYRLAHELGGPRAAWIATALLTIDVETNRWHVYVLSDSLYLSVFTGSVWLVARATQAPRNWSRYAVAAAGLILAGLIRPEGWFVIPAAAMFWVVSGFQSRVTQAGAGLAIVVASTLLVVVVAPRLTGNLSAVGPGEMLRRGQTIWEYDGWRLTMPAASSGGSGGDSARGAVRYAIEHPIKTVELMAARVAVHLAHIRPFYSTLHNTAIVIWLA